MDEQTLKLLQYIKEGKTCNEICVGLNISNNELYEHLNNLKNKGFFFKRKYYGNGTITYKTIRDLSGINKLKKSAFNSIITEHKDEQMRCLVISDLHFGNSLESIELLNRAYNYCVKNGIHIVLCCGDMIDGTFSKVEQNIEDIYTQIEHFIKDYPFDKNVLTFGVAGDHDYSGLCEGGQDITEAVRNYRHDIIIGDYNNSVINIKSDSITLHHHILGGTYFNYVSPIVFNGHLHKYKINMQTNHLNVCVPSLSLINESLPTAVDVVLNFNKGYISLANFKQIYFGDKDYVLNETEYDLLKNRKVEFGPIYNEMPIRQENLISEEVKETVDLQPETTESSEKILTKKANKSLSQIDKFKIRLEKYLNKNRQ